MRVTPITFESTEQAIAVQKEIMGQFLPELYYALRAESDKRAVEPHHRMPIYDILLISGFPNSGRFGETYHPRNVSFFASKIEILAAQVHDGRIGAPTLLACMDRNETPGNVLHVYARKDLAVDPSVLCSVAQRYDLQLVA
jgi:hypothetical protein